MPARSSTEPVLAFAATSTRMARKANSRLLRVSCACSRAGLTHTRSTVLQLPPMEPSRIRVSLLSRKGTCGLFAASALTTFPSAKRLLLMAVASLKCMPSTPLFFTRSEPARSTRCRCVALRAAGTPGLALRACSTVTASTVCARLERWFMAVSARRFRVSPVSSSCMRSAAQRHSTGSAPCNNTGAPATSSRMRTARPEARQETSSP
mmetsp:Transcript_47004/g.142649  ORF Transcript_47004/g.142649 Transcript_47004/m.142649 type:complete len:208 (-) Transcript_47004:147-770(-)